MQGLSEFSASAGGDGASGVEARDRARKLGLKGFWCFQFQRLPRRIEDHFPISGAADHKTK